MSAAPKRATVYLDPELHRALRLKAVETDRSISDIVNEAVRESLAEDAKDLESFDERAKERSLRFEDVVRSMKRRGRL
jgi:predicted transcriptional regulator